VTTDAAALRLATVPAEHPYLDSALPVTVHRVAVPAPTGVPWAPSALFEPTVLVALADRIDVVHLHFGFDHLSADELRHWTDLLTTLDVPLVFTAHDLRNPHHDNPREHRRHLDVLVPAAAEVLTLTPGAAKEIASRWGRPATVVAHPAVLELVPGPAPTTAGLVGLHLKSLRRNVVEPGRVVAAALRGARAAHGVLQVDVHPEVLARPELAAVHALAAVGDLRLRVHERFTDDELAAYLQSLHVSVLANRFGSHSGWLEACRDAGTAVVAPSCGYYAEQWAEVVGYRNDEQHGLDEQSLTAAVCTALSTPAPAPADPGYRAGQRAHVRRTHDEVYRRALAARRATA